MRNQSAGAAANAHQHEGPDRNKSLDEKEVNLLLKFLQGMGELPPINTGGDARSKGHNLKVWKVAVESLLKQTRPVVKEWWSWAWVWI